MSCRLDMAYLKDTSKTSQSLRDSRQRCRRRAFDTLKPKEVKRISCEPSVISGWPRLPGFRGFGTIGASTLRLSALFLPYFLLLIDVFFFLILLVTSSLVLVCFGLCLACHEESILLDQLCHRFPFHMSCSWSRVERRGINLVCRIDLS